MYVLLAGLNTRDAAAMEMLIGMSWTDVRVGRARAGRGAAPQSPELSAAADLCVVDLAGMGWAQWSAGHEADLLQMLRGRAAVALVPPGGGGWLDVKHAGALKQALEWVAKPASATTLRAALDRIKATLRARADGLLVPASAPVSAPATPPASAPTPEPRAPRAQVAAPASSTASSTSCADPTAPAKAIAATPAAPAPVATPAPRTSLHLGEAEQAALLQAFPALRGNPFMRLLLRLLGTEQPQELRLGPQHALVVHPAQGWVAGNIAQAALLRLVRFDASAAAFQFNALGAGQATERSLALGRHEALESFVWRLAASGFDQQPLTAERDLALRLQRYPDFAWMQDGSELNLQLAALCARSRQTLFGLQRSFPDQDPALVTRFVLCALLSGQASLEPMRAQPGGAAAAPQPTGLASAPAPAARPDAARKGFLRALLARLF